MSYDLPDIELIQEFSNIKIKDNSISKLNKIEINNKIIEVRNDGFINATQLCKVGNKEFKGWFRLESTKKLINALRETIIKEMTENTQSQEIILFDIKKGGNQKKQGSWIHPLLVTNLAMWISSDFGLKISEWIEEWKKHSEENEKKYFYELSRIKPSKNNQREKEIQIILAKKLNAKIEIETQSGFIDVMTKESIIEIKEFSKWKGAMGQILSYSIYYPEKEKIIYLFGEIDDLLLPIIKETYQKYDIKLCIYE